LKIGGILFFRRQHLQGQVLVEACQEEQGGIRVSEVDIVFQENQTSHQGLETGIAIVPF